MKIIHNTIGIIFSFALLVILIISSVEIVAYKTPNFYSIEYSKYDVSSNTGVSLEDLIVVTDQMMSYLRGDRDRLSDIKTTINGIDNELFFNEQDCLHMSDVRNLFVAALIIRRILLAVCLILIISLLVLKADIKSLLSRTMIISSIILTVFLALFTVVASQDFTKYFTLFHHIFFTNDLWMFDPATDHMINMLPEPFFMDIAARIGATFGIIVFILLMISSFVLILSCKRHHS